MRAHEERDDALINRWAAGRLTGGERRAFEARLIADPALAARARLQGAIEDSLRRSFAPPPVILPPAVREAEGAGGEASVVQAGNWLDWGPLAGVAAACLALLLYAIGERSGEETPPAGPVLAGVVEEKPPGPLVPTPAVEDPSYDNVYWVAGSLGQGGGLDASATPCAREELPADGGLVRFLGRRYGQPLALASEVESRLQGPFRLPEWPSASILVSYPDDLGGRPVVLVIESEENHRCCVHPREPVRDDLRAFVWPVGKVRITELTPDREPRYLQHFEVRYRAR